jgi:hypothetical protein
MKCPQATAAAATASSSSSPNGHVRSGYPRRPAVE